VTIITGNVGPDGQVVDGTGFTVTHLSTGRYLITFTTPFPATPTVLVTKVYGSVTVDAGTGVQPAENAIVDQASPDTALIATGNANGTLTDGAFGLLAITVP
jgi:hypothetical protein